MRREIGDEVPQRKTRRGDRRPRPGRTGLVEAPDGTRRRCEEARATRELDRGHGIPWKGNYSSWLEQKGARLKAEEKTESKRQKTLARELEWVRQGVKGRGVKQKARLANYEKMLGADVKVREENLEIFIPFSPNFSFQYVITV